MKFKESSIKSETKIKSLFLDYYISEKVSNGISHDVNSIEYKIYELAKLCSRNDKENFSDRFSLYPLKDRKSFEFYKIQENASWNPDELDFSKDRIDYIKASKYEKRIIESILGFFSVIDGIVIEAVFLRLLIESKTFEERLFYISQLRMESIHSEAYSNMLKDIIPQNRINKILKKSDKMISIREQELWIESYIKCNLPKSYMLLANTCVEGIFLMTPFILIFYFRSINKFPGIIFANEQISKDENIHFNYGCFNYIRNGKINEKHAQRIVKEAVKLSSIFINEIFPLDEEFKDSNIKINKNIIFDFIKHLGNRTLEKCNHKKIWNININIFPNWMKEISNEQKSNFHELPVGNYSLNSPNINIEKAYVDYSIVDF